MTDISRRAVIVGVTATAAAAALGTVLVTPPLALAEPAELQETTFGRLSAILTGIPVGILNPDVDPLQLNREIFLKISGTKHAKTLTLMLQKFAAAKPEDQVAAVKSMVTKWDKANDDQDAMCFLGRSIILAWYLGAWYDPDSLKQLSYAKREAYYAYRRYSSKVLIPHTVLSANAYTSGMVWRAMQAHPMGYSNLQFGYWAKKPPDLVSFIQPIPPFGGKK
jgi:hypothetical protein